MTGGPNTQTESRVPASWCSLKSNDVFKAVVFVFLLHAFRVHAFLFFTVQLVHLFIYFQEGWRRMPWLLR